jgi:hypothetical protein
MNALLKKVNQEEGIEYLKMDVLVLEELFIKTENAL